MSGSFGFNQSKSKSKDLTPTEYTAERGGVVQQLLSRLGGDFASPNSFVAPFSPVEEQAFNAFAQNAFGPIGLGTNVDTYLSQSLGQQNPFLGAAIDAAIAPVLENAQLQELRDRALFTQAGQKVQGSSAFGKTRAEALKGTERTVGDIASQLAFQDRQMQQQAAALASERLNAQVSQVQALALPRLVEQLGIDRANEELNRRQSIMDQALQLLASLTSPTLGSSSSGFGFSAALSATPGGGGTTTTG